MRNRQSLIIRCMKTCTCAYLCLDHIKSIQNFLETGVFVTNLEATQIDIILILNYANENGDVD